MKTKFIFYIGFHTEKDPSIYRDEIKYQLEADEKRIGLLFRAIREVFQLLKEILDN